MLSERIIPFSDLFVCFSDLLEYQQYLLGRNFKKECPNGILDKGKVSKIYEQKLVPNEDSKFLVDQLFRIIDDDNNGGIDFKVPAKLWGYL